jgi:hypothetical protein
MRLLTAKVCEMAFWLLDGSRGPTHPVFLEQVGQPQVQATVKNM